MRARVVIEVPCDASGCVNGQAKQTTWTGETRYEFVGPCLVCHGTGTVPQTVTCAGCRHWERDPNVLTFGHCKTSFDSDESPWCANNAGEVCWLETEPAFACSAWEARE